MADIINIGSGPNSGNGDTLLTAANKVNAEFARLAAIAPVNISALSALTLASGSILEDTPPGVLIGSLAGKTAGSVVDIIDDGGMQVVMDVDYTLRTGLRAASFFEGDVTIVVREKISDGVTRLERTSTIVIPVTEDVAITAAASPNQHFKRVASGTGDGSSWANAKGLSGLASAVAGASAGTVFGLLADDGIIDYATNILLAPTAAVTIKGMRTDYNPRHVCFRGTRARWSRPTNPATVSNAGAILIGDNIYDMKDNQANAGGTLFTLGGSSGTISHIAAMHYSTPFPFSGSGITGWNINDLAAFNSGRVLSDIGSQGSAPNIVNTNIRRLKAIGVSKPAIRMRGNSNNVLIEDCDIDLRRVDGDAFGVGYSLDDRSSNSDPVLKLQGAHNITYRRCIARNAHASGTSSDYWNADGFSCERGNYDILYDECEAYGCTDGGWDYKGVRVTMRGCIAEDNKRNYRIWSYDVVMEDCISRKPRLRGGTGGSMHLWLSGGSALGNRGADVMWTGGGMYDDGYTGLAIDMSDQYGGNVLRLIDVDEAAGGIATNGNYPTQLARVMRAATAPTGAPSLTSGALDYNVVEGGSVPLALTFDRDVTMKLSGADLSSFTLGHINNGPATVRALVYTPGGDNDRQVTVTVQDIARNSLVVTPSITVTELLDARILEAKFQAGTANSQNILDTSPKVRALSWGANARVQQLATGDNRLRLIGGPSHNGDTTYRVTCSDNADFHLSGAFTLEAVGVRFDAVNFAQHVFGQWPSSGSGRSFRFVLTSSGVIQFVMSTDGTNDNLTLNGPALTADTDYTFRVTRDPSGVILFYVDDVLFTTDNNTGALYDSTLPFTIGGNSGSQSQMGGWIREANVWKGKAIAP